MILRVCWMGRVMIIKSSRPIQRCTWRCRSEVVRAQVVGIGPHSAFVVVGMEMRSGRGRVDSMSCWGVHLRRVGSCCVLRVCMVRGWTLSLRAAHVRARVLEHVGVWRIISARVRAGAMHGTMFNVVW